MKIWLVTDTHFGHDKMMEYCKRPIGFEEKILKNLINCVKENDVLIHLGDICIGGDEYWHEKLSGIKCKKWLVKGNHDRKSDKWYLEHGWDFVSDKIVGKYFGKKIMFSHMPQYYLQTNSEDDLYDLNIHGHFHNKTFRSSEKAMVARKNFRQRLLSLEHLNYKPISLETFLRDDDKFVLKI